jgi:ABC-type multidrug transport system fused ATPase/permease subunit
MRASTSRVDVAGDAGVTGSRKAMRARLLALAYAEPATALGAVASLAGLAGVQLGLTWVLRAWIGGPLTTPGAAARPVIVAGAALLITGALGVWLSRWLVARFTHHLARTLRDDVAARLLRRSLPSATGSSGDLAARLTGDVDIVSQGLATVAQRVLREGLILAGAVALMLVVAWPLLVVVAVAAPPLAWTVARASGAIRRWSTASRAAAGEVGRIVGEQHEALLTIKTLQTEAAETTRVRTAIARATDAAIAAEWHASVVLAMVFAATGAIVLAVMAAGAALVGPLVERLDLVTFVLLLAQVIEPARRLAEVQTELARVDGAWIRVHGLQDVVVEATRQSSDVGAPGPRATIAVRARALVIAQGGRPLLRLPRWEVRHGDHVALVGASGAGKTTLLTAMIGAGTIAGGHLEVCGVPVEAQSLHHLRARTSLVPQQTMLFGATLRDNVTYGSPHAAEVDVLRVCDACGLAALVASHPHGLDQPLLTTGRHVSAGERQRIGLARAVLRDPALLLLDEATSALDGAQEDAIFDALGPWLAQRTVVLVSHRLATAMRMRDVVLLRDGDLRTGNWRVWPFEDAPLLELFASQDAPVGPEPHAVSLS